MIEQFIFAGHKEYGRFVERNDNYCARKIFVRARGGLVQCSRAHVEYIGGFGFCKQHAKAIRAAQNSKPDQTLTRLADWADGSA